MKTRERLSDKQKFAILSKAFEPLMEAIPELYGFELNEADAHAMGAMFNHYIHGLALIHMGEALQRQVDGAKKSKSGKTKKKAAKRKK